MYKQKIIDKCINKCKTFKITKKNKGNVIIKITYDKEFAEIYLNIIKSKLSTNNFTITNIKDKYYICCSFHY